MANRTKLTAKKVGQFLGILKEGGSASKGAQAIGVSRSALYDLRSGDEEFAQQWAEAVETGTDVLEDEAFRRAKEGTLKPVFYRGTECGQVREYSDTLLIFTLKARRPEKFGDRQKFEHSGVGGAAIQLVHSVPRPKYTDEN